MAIWEGAKRKFGDETDEVTWEVRDSVWVRDSDVVAFYDHTLMMRNGRLINVMGTFEEIARKMRIPVSGKMVKKEAGTDSNAEKKAADGDEVVADPREGDAAAAKKAAGKILGKAMEQVAAYEQGVSGND